MAFEAEVADEFDETRGAFGVGDLFLDRGFHVGVGVHVHVFQTRERLAGDHDHAVAETGEHDERLWSSRRCAGRKSKARR